MVIEIVLKFTGVTASLGGRVGGGRAVSRKNNLHGSSRGSCRFAVEVELKAILVAEFEIRFNSLQFVSIRFKSFQISVAA